MVRVRMPVSSLGQVVVSRTSGNPPTLDQTSFVTVTLNQTFGRGATSVAQKAPLHGTLPNVYFQILFVTLNHALNQVQGLTNSGSKDFRVSSPQILKQVQNDIPTDLLLVMYN
jgi:hypothetical protein